jgi:serine O-acetyltransferase
MVKSISSIPGYRYMFLVRTVCFLRSRGFLYKVFYVIVRLLINHYKYKYGIDIPYNTNIGVGFYIGHFGGIFINSNVVIGTNCNINHDVTIGITYGGKNPGVPRIGNNVYMGPGSKIIGGIIVGDNVAIGANSVVIESVSDNAVVAGNPAKIISHKGSADYVVNCVDSGDTTH